MPIELADIANSRRKNLEPIEEFRRLAIARKGIF
jgi:hypothetical protein